MGRTPRPAERNSALVVGVGVGVVSLALGATGVAVGAAAVGYALSRRPSRRAVGGHFVSLAPCPLGSVSFVPYFRRQPYSEEQWKHACNEDGTIQRFDSMVHHVSEKGLDLGVKPHLWPYLLGIYDASTTSECKKLIQDKLKASYENLLESCKASESKIQAFLQTPLAAEMSQLGINPYSGQVTRSDLPDALKQFWEAQRIIVQDAVRTDFTKNSLTTVGAITSWLNSAIADSSVYQKLSAKQEWWHGYWLSALARHQLDHAQHYSADQKRQALRMVNLLSAYAIHDPEIGYCQGMSDLALPFLLLLDDDALAFWCFERLMQKVRRNFAVEDSGIFAQLATLARLLQLEDPPLYDKLRQMRATDCHFAYRMIVVLMRRELPLEQVLRLWEMLWADDLLSNHGTSDACHGSHGSSHAAPSTTASSHAARGGSALATWAACCTTAKVVPERSEEGPTSIDHQASTSNPHPQAEPAADAVAAQQHQQQQQQRPLVAPAGSAEISGRQPPGQEASEAASQDHMQHAAAMQQPTSEPGPGQHQQVAGQPCEQSLFMYFIAAVVISQRRKILNDCVDSDDALKLFQKLSQLDIIDLVNKAKGYRAKHT